MKFGFLDEQNTTELQREKYIIKRVIQSFSLSSHYLIRSHCLINTHILPRFWKCNFK